MSKPFFTPSEEPNDPELDRRLFAFGQAAIDNGWRPTVVVGKAPRYAWSDAKQTFEKADLQIQLCRTYITPCAENVPWAWQNEKGDWVGRHHPTAIGTVIFPGVVAMDFDINHENIMRSIYRRIRAKLGERVDRFIQRGGGGWKELHIAGFDGDPFVRLSSPTFLDRATGISHKLEVFGGAVDPRTGAYSRQVVLHGLYPGDGAYDFLTDVSPANTRVDELPALSLAEIGHVIEIVSEEARKFGMEELDEVGAPGDYVFCLEPDQVLQSSSGSIEVSSLVPGDRVRLYEILGPLGIEDGRSNYTKGLVQDRERFGIGVWDTETRTFYALKSAQPKKNREFSELALELAQRLGLNSKRERAHAAAKAIRELAGGADGSQ